ncbi:MAG: hypothetical protein LLF89_05180 [Spirochaetaceae bacterium]|nr:hypothetical protein [Spirochaetaceae bacterium]
MKDPDTAAASERGATGAGGSAAEQPGSGAVSGQHRSAPLWTVLKSWWSNSAADQCGGVSWVWVVVIFLASTIALAVPFGANRWRVASFNAKMENYPGLGAAFMALAKDGGEFAVQKGRCTFADATPRTLHASGWAVILGKEGLPPEDMDKVLWFGTENLSIQNKGKEAGFALSWEPFEGLDSVKLQRAAESRQSMADLIAGMLFTANFTGMTNAIVTLILLMLVQNLVFVAVLGLLLSFAALRARVWPGSAQGQSSGVADSRGGKAKAVMRSIKVVACVVSGPAFLVGVVSLTLPGAKSSWLWLVYSLLAAVRVIVLYSARYKLGTNPPQGVNPPSGTKPR